MDLSWNPKSVTGITDLHSGHVHYASGTLPNGETLPAPKYTSVRILGISAYWLGPEPSPAGNGPATNIDQLSATKDGYVIVLQSLSLTESQDQRVLAAMLSRI